MTLIRTTMLSAALAAGLAACAQAPVDHSAHATPAAAPAADGHDHAAMTRMDQHMQSMKAMRERLAAARSPEERQRLMAEHMKLMREGMSMMGGKGGHGMHGGMGHHAMMEKRMAMMQSMMEAMLDRLEAAPPAAPARP